MENKSIVLVRGFGGMRLCCLAVMSFVAQALGQPATFTVQPYPLLGNTHVAADFNGDGRPDLAGSGLNAASIMLGNGNGTFGAKTDFPVGVQTQDVGAGDFNGDGKMDLVITLNSPQVSLALLTGTGTGSFNTPVFFPNTSGFDSPAVLATDINNDGKLDVIVMHSIACFTAPCTSARSVTVMLGNGNGTFQQPHEVDVNTFPHAMALGDFNRDSIKDLAVGGENTELSILLGVGDGTFVRQPLILLVQGGDLFSACNDVDVADFNRDGVQDIVVPLGNGNGVAIVLGNADGTFAVSSRFLEDAVSSPQSIAVADYNGDGFFDVARGMGDSTQGLLQIMRGNGNGTFQPVVRYVVPPPQSSVGGGWLIATDLNGDSKPDLALQVRGANPAIDILLNTSGTPPLQLVSAVSRKTHAATGPFDVHLPFTGQPAVESRNSGGENTLLFSFNNNITGASASVTGGIGAVAGSPAMIGNKLSVNLTGIANAQTVTVTLTNVTDTFGQVLPTTTGRVSFLFGDTNGDGFVNAGDAVQTRNCSGQTTNGTNFRSDVSVDGFVNSGDTLIVRSRSGTALP